MPTFSKSQKIKNYIISKCSPDHENSLPGSLKNPRAIISLRPSSFKKKFPLWERRLKRLAKMQGAGE
jgi:hypothetical protein